MTLILGSDYRYHSNHILCIAHSADCRSSLAQPYLIPTSLALNIVWLSEAGGLRTLVVVLMLCWSWIPEEAPAFSRGDPSQLHS